MFCHMGRTKLPPNWFYSVSLPVMKELQGTGSLNRT